MVTKRIRYLILVISSIVPLLYFMGCAYLGITSYPMMVQEQKRLLSSGKFDQALEGLQKGGKGWNNQLLSLMEQGMIYHLQGKFQESVTSFEQALSLIKDYDDRAVISARDVASQLLTLPANDNAISYKGYAFERVLLNTYQAMNYLFLGDPEKARVEILRTDQRQKKELERHSREVSEYQNWGKKRKIEVDKYPAFDRVRGDIGQLGGSLLNSFQNAFTYYLSGIVFELNGEENDAYIDYKKTYQLNPDFPSVKADLLRLSKKLGFVDQQAEWSKRFGDADQDVEVGTGQAASEIIIFLAEGYIAQKQEIKVSLVINNTPFTVAVPTYSSNEDGSMRRSTFLRVIDSGEVIGQTSPVTNLNPLAFKALEEQLPIIFTRQLARLVTKTAVSRQFQPNDAALAFVASSLYSIVSENADLRNWLLLPRTIQVLRKRVAPGTHNFILEIQTASARVMNRQNVSITLQVGEVGLLNLRSMEDSLLISQRIVAKPKSGL